MEGWAYWLLGASSGLAFWILIGYPLLLWQVKPKGLAVAKDRSDSYAPTVSVLLAVHNGEAFLGAKLDSLLELDYPRERMEILVLGDGCSDATSDVVARYQGLGIKYFDLPRGGKSAALNAGLEKARGEILFFTDVRQRLDQQALRELVGNFADAKVGAVTGELQILKPGQAAEEQEHMDLYWRYELWARRWHTAEFSLFNTTGCLYAMRRSLARPIAADTLIDDAEFPLQAYRAGYRIVFDETSIAYDYPTQAGGEWRRRMRTMAGMWQVFARNPWLLFKPHRMWLHFVSHKLGRLLLPWALLGTVLGTAALPEGWLRAGLWAGNAGFLGLALGARIGQRQWGRIPVIGRLGSLAWTFLAMNGAALLSVRVFWGDARSFWSNTTQVDKRVAKVKEDGVRGDSR